MYIIAGLGNPGKNYAGTRHNIGFDTLDVIASKNNIKFNKTKFRADFGEGIIGGEKVILVKPQTFMNLSGESIRPLRDFYKVPDENIIIIYDDISLPLGKLRLRGKGSAGGHNGMKSIIYQLNTDVFPRLKIGVGAPPHEDYDLADYVLEKFGKDEIEILTKTIDKVNDAVESIIRNGVEKTMSKFNG